MHKVAFILAFVCCTSIEQRATLAPLQMQRSQVLRRHDALQVMGDGSTAEMCESSEREIAQGMLSPLTMLATLLLALHPSVALVASGVGMQPVDRSSTLSVSRPVPLDQHDRFIISAPLPQARREVERDNKESSDQQQAFDRAPSKQSPPEVQSSNMEEQVYLTEQHEIQQSMGLVQQSELQSMDFSKLKVADLKAILKALGEKVSGNKAELIARLEAHTELMAPGSKIDLQEMREQAEQKELERMRRELADVSEFHLWKAAALKDKLRALGEKTTGKKADLVSRLNKLVKEEETRLEAMEEDARRKATAAQTLKDLKSKAAAAPIKATAAQTLKDLKSKAAAAKEHVDDAVARRRAETDRAHELEKDSFAALPPGIRERRLASQRMRLTEYVDYSSAQQALKELSRAANDTALTEPQRHEAEYLEQYLREYLALLEQESIPRAILPPECVADSDTRLVLATEFNYFSRHGGGRRYTTIERHTGKQHATKIFGAIRNEGLARHSKDRRAYGLQGCPRALRAQLCGAFAHDVDMKSAHPSIAIQLREMLLREEEDQEVRTLLEEATLVNFKDYVANRDTPKTGWVERVCKHHQIDGPFDQRKECVKKLFCRLMFGGLYATWMREPYGKDSTQRPKGGPLHSVTQMERELAQLRKAVFASSRWCGFVAAETEWLRHEAARNGRKFDPLVGSRSIFSRIMQTIENDILDQLVVSLRKEGWCVTTLIFDGCHVLHRPDHSLSDALRSAEEHIKRVTGFAVELVEKPLHGEHHAAIELTRI